jgi:hypothetical protein
MLRMIFNAITVHSTPEVTKMLIAIKGEMTRKEIQQVLGLKDEKHFRQSYLQHAVAAGFS